MPVDVSEHGLTPAEQYLRALWRGKWLFLAIVGAFVAGAEILNLVLPKSYSSQALVSVRQSPRIESAGMLYNTVIAGSGAGAQVNPALPPPFIRRLQANRTVTLAARDAEVIAAGVGLDDRQISQWIEINYVDRTDLITVDVNQPTAEKAQKFAERLLERTIESTKQENAAAQTRHLLAGELEKSQAALKDAETGYIKESADTGLLGRQVRLDRAKLELDLARDTYSAVRKRLSALDLVLSDQQLELGIVDPPTLPIRPSFPRPMLNISIGLILGVLTATVTVILRSVFLYPRAVIGAAERGAAVR